MSSQNRIAVSVADLPLNVPWEKCFAMAAEAGADGVELMGGPRAGWNHSRIDRWARELKLPIVSVHQASWEILRLIVAEGNMKQAAGWANLYVIHPPLTRGDDGNGYFESIDGWAKKYRMKVCLENMPPTKMMKWVNFLGKTDAKWVEVEEVAKECQRRGWTMTLDTSHWQQEKPDEKKLARILPVLENIHISDWGGDKQHLGLGQGRMDIEAWMRWILRYYPGQVTLELTPKYWVDGVSYLRELQESIRILRLWLK